MRLLDNCSLLERGYIASILAMTEADKVQFNVYLPRDLVRRIKHRAIDEGQPSMSVFVERLLEQYLEEKK
ncbi:hypothetical protein BH11ACT2_BH11ACT2_18300 [soil metagenome]